LLTGFKVQDLGRALFLRLSPMCTCVLVGVEVCSFLSTTTTTTTTHIHPPTAGPTTPLTTPQQNKRFCFVWADLVEKKVASVYNTARDSLNTLRPPVWQKRLRLGRENTGGGMNLWGGECWVPHKCCTQHTPHHKPQTTPTCFSPRRIGFASLVVAWAFRVNKG